jgi:hypothetical protein
MALDLHVAGAEIAGARVGEVAAALESLDVVERSGERMIFKCAGVIATDQRITLILPRAYKQVPPEGEWEAAGRLLLSVLLRYAYRDARPAQRSVADAAAHVLQSSAAASEHGLARFEAAFALMSDARKNGPYYVAATREDANHGRIHWRRTLERSSPAGHPFCETFPTLVMLRTARDAEHPLTRLHRTTVASARELLGLGPQPSAAVSSPTALRVIRAHDRSVYSDRGRFLLGLLRRYHQRKASAATAGPLVAATYLFTRQFHWLWDRMLRVAIGPIEGSAGLRGGYWTSSDSERPKAGLDLRPDLVVRDSGEVFIIDAKDYAEGSLPGTADITKQIVYRLLHTTAFKPASGTPLTATRNAFVFPSTERAVGGVRCRSVHRVGAGDSLGWCTIACLDVSYERVAEAYVADRPDATLRASVLAAMRAACT